MIVNNSTNINKSETIEHKNDHPTWRCKSRS